MSETVRLVRNEIVQHGQDDREATLAELDNLTQGIPLLKQSAAPELRRGSRDARQRAMAHAYA